MIQTLSFLLAAVLASILVAFASPADARMADAGPALGRWA